MQRTTLAGGFDAREFIGPNETCNRLGGFQFNSEFWLRMAGFSIDPLEVEGHNRNVGDAFAASSAGSGLSLTGSGAGRTVLSPAVADWSPSLAVPVGLPVKASVTFDTVMARRGFAIRVGGTCRPRFLIASGFVDDRTLEFFFLPQQVGTARIEISRARSGDNEIAMDGNQNPEGFDHVGPNGDSFVWAVACVPAPAGSPSPTTPPTAAVTPTPTAPSTPTHTPTETASSGRAVILGAATGLFPAGSEICLERASQGCIADPELCADVQLHREILIDGQGPYPDSSVDPCGHGKIVERAGCGPDTVPAC